MQHTHSNNVLIMSRSSFDKKSNALQNSAVKLVLESKKINKKKSRKNSLATLKGKA